MKITIIGAGKTGRGFVARLVNGNEITFIDKNADLVNALNQKGSIEVSYFGDKRPKENVVFSRAYTWQEVGTIDAEIIFVSVGGSNLADVGQELSTRIKSGQRIIVCENASKPAEKLYNAIGIQGVVVAESTVFCTTIEGQGVDINSEWYPYLQFDAEPMKDNLPCLGNIKPVFEFGNFLNRKLFTYNSASCIIAYLGYQKGYTVYSDAANDPEILAKLDHNYAVINECMCLEYGYDKDDQKEFALLSRDKFTDRTIVDTVARNAREPQRKIGATERVAGPLKLQAKYGKDTTVLEQTLAAMLDYTPEQEVEWQAILARLGKDGVLREMAGISPESEMGQRILAMTK